jgi:hypothetical protein
MKGASETSKRKGVHEPVPYGKAREEAIAAIVAEAEARMRAGPSILAEITPELWEELRNSDLSEILGSGGPERVNPPS